MQKKKFCAQSCWSKVFLYINTMFIYSVYTIYYTVKLKEHKKIDKVVQILQTPRQQMMF